MVALTFVVACLLYLGRILAWIWGSKPIELGDVVFLVPILLIVFVIRRRRIRGGPRPSAASAEVDASDEAIRPSQEGRSEAHGSEDILRLQQEWATAEYHWWKR